MATYDSDNPYSDDEDYDPYRDNDDYDPYRQNFDEPSVRSTDSSKKWVVGCIIAFVIFFFCLCCGGIGGLAIVGIEFKASDVKEELNKMPIVKEKVGEITECELNFFESAQLDKTTDAFQFEGKKASGKAILTFDEEKEKIVEGVLILDDGEEIDLFAAPPALDDAPDVGSKIAPPAPNAPPAPIQKEEPPKKNNEKDSPPKK